LMTARVLGSFRRDFSIKEVVCIVTSGNSLPPVSSRLRDGEAEMSVVAVALSLELTE
jgi:hypothetical protein